jgi:hypothetical protein
MYNNGVNASAKTFCPENLAAVIMASCTLLQNLKSVNIPTKIFPSQAVLSVP